ncbi:hypothetical protein LguiA_007643 [Lonicera macranthoides]
MEEEGKWPAGVFGWFALHLAAGLIPAIGPFGPALIRGTYHLITAQLFASGLRFGTLVRIFTAAVTTYSLDETKQEACTYKKIHLNSLTQEETKKLQSYLQILGLGFDGKGNQRGALERGRGTRAQI